MRGNSGGWYLNRSIEGGRYSVLQIHMYPHTSVNTHVNQVSDWRDASVGKMLPCKLENLSSIPKTQIGWKATEEDT